MGARPGSDGGGARLVFLERQIEELYGPLSSLLREGRRSFDDPCHSLGHNHQRWKDEQVPCGWRSSVAWPVLFEVDVHRSLQELKARHDLLLGRMSARD